MNRPDFSVADLGELDTLITTDIAQGANVWVDSDGAYWTLEKNSGAVVGPTVRQPLVGAPRAGAQNARWIRNVGGGGGGVTGGPGTITYRPGAVAPLPPGVVATWADLMQVVGTAAGPITVAVDTSLAPTAIPVGVHDFKGRATLVPFTTTTLGAAVLVDIPDGAQLLDLAGASGWLEIHGHGTAVRPLAFTPTPAGQVNFYMGPGYTSLINDTGGAIVPMITLAAGSIFNATIDQAVWGQGKILEALAGSNAPMHFFNGAVVTDFETLSGAGNIGFTYDRSVSPVEQSLATAISSILLDCGPALCFSAGASLFGPGSAVAQNIPPGSQLLTTLALGLGLIVTVFGTYTRVRYQYTGDVANAAGQTLTLGVSFSGGGLIASLAGLPSGAGVHSGSFVIPGAYFPTIGEIVTTTITPSAPLAAPVTNLMMAVAQ